MDIYNCTRYGNIMESNMHVIILVLKKDLESWLKFANNYIPNIIGSMVVYTCFFKHCKVLQIIERMHKKMVAHCR